MKMSILFQGFHALMRWFFTCIDIASYCLLEAHARCGPVSQVELARLRREEEVASASAQRERLEQTVRVLQQELATKQEEAQAAQVRLVSTC